MAGPTKTATSERPRHRRRDASIRHKITCVRPSGQLSFTRCDLYKLSAPRRFNERPNGGGDYPGDPRAPLSPCVISSKGGGREWDAARDIGPSPPLVHGPGTGRRNRNGMQRRHKVHQTATNEADAGLKRRVGGVRRREELG
ncbi:hypothetical protein GWI33_015114 [Rhynchophorus ferrugineus]|uniref:Uncharacterized protein n=1 Tax=Rhynchophorus ferrugineus TaxID=354439 RepID=A0A834I0B8_RHYFE|nr:hypothetical protein GWI33_015114 [Rhynchophorus ferrugineus]